MANRTQNRRRTSQSASSLPGFFEFFAGGGMARAGLGDQWKCLFSNDIDERKGAVYRFNWGDSDLRICDINSLTASDLPNHADLAWASFPCQDLSLAGDYRGLKGERSGTFWSFWRLMTELHKENRSPELIVLENVCGALTSHGGQDFVSICEAMISCNYRVGAIIADALEFVPQSRPRLFIIAVSASVTIPKALHSAHPSPHWHKSAVQTAFAALSDEQKANWIWWSIPPPPAREYTLLDILEPDDAVKAWHSREETQRLIDMMNDLHRAKVAEAQKLKTRTVGAIYRRTRIDDSGVRRQRAEVRFDGIAGCLRTPAGGSSRQILLIVEGAKVRSRLITAREAARLMGLPDSYTLPANYNDAYHLTGDGVVVPVVRHLAQHLLEPLAAVVSSGKVEAA